MRAAELRSGPVRQLAHPSSAPTRPPRPICRRPWPRCAPSLAAQGVDFIPNSLVRGRKLAPNAVAAAADRPAADRRAGAHARRDRGGGRAAADRARRRGALGGEHPRGARSSMLAAPFYPQAALQRGAAREPRGSGRRSMFFLSIRSYDTLLPSAYAEIAEARAAAAGRLRGDPGAAARRRRRAGSTSCRASAPRRRRCRSRIWRQEDYRANAQAIMEAVCGCALGALPEISDPTWTRSPSAEAIAAAEALPRDPAAGGARGAGQRRSSPQPPGATASSRSRRGAAAAARRLRGRPRAHRREVFPDVS